MNTTKKGNTFENKSYELIEKAVNAGQLGIINTQCRLFKKKGYYSKDREKDIIFDLTIEVWPPNSDRYSLLYIIECKNYSSAVPVNDIEEFYSKINQVGGANIKGVFMANSSFQIGTYNFAKNKGIMLIEALADDDCNIILYKTSRDSSANDTITKYTENDLIKNFLERVFSTQGKGTDEKIKGLKRYSKDNIETITSAIIGKCNPNILKHYKNLSLKELQHFLTKTYSLSFDFDSNLGIDSKGSDILGLFDPKTNYISIDKSVVNSVRFPFVLGHEVGHYMLHRKLSISQQRYNEFRDSQYNFTVGRHQLTNQKNWMEWQANYFSAALLMPKTSVQGQVILYQMREGIRNKGRIYVDSQKTNVDDFYKIAEALSKVFLVSRTNIIFRLQDLGILQFAYDVKHWSHYFDVDNYRPRSFSDPNNFSQTA